MSEEDALRIAEICKNYIKVMQQQQQKRIIIVGGVSILFVKKR